MTIELLKIAGNRARVGVHAPASVAMHRHEVWGRLAVAGEFPVGMPPVACQVVG